MTSPREIELTEPEPVDTRRAMERLDVLDMVYLLGLDGKVHFNQDV